MPISKPWMVLGFLLWISPSVAGHGRLIDPAARSAMWRFDFGTHVDVNDNAMYCGGHTGNVADPLQIEETCLIQSHFYPSFTALRNFPNMWGGNFNFLDAQRYYQNGKRCGICGEAWDSERNYDGGGQYATGIIVRNYTMGQEIDVTVDLTANHLGYYIFRICPNNDYRKAAKQECLDKHPLQLADGSGTRVKVDSDMNLEDTFKLRLPENITCEQCVFQWSYYTGTTNELFQNCADISIHESQKSKEVICTGIGKMKGLDQWCVWKCGSGHCEEGYGPHCVCFFKNK